MGVDDDDDDAESQNTDDYLMDASPFFEQDVDDLIRQGFQKPPNPKDKQKARVTDDKQIKNQSTKAKPDVKTSAKNSQKRKKSSELEATQILTGYEAKILAELKLWGNAIKCSVKWQHKYQTLRAKIALSSFALPQFNKYWTTDLGAIIHDIPEDMMMATLWTDCKPGEFLMKCGASSFKVIQTSKGRRKLVAYFENWETILRALDTPQFFVPNGKELKWCRHSIPILKKVQSKPKAKNTPNTKKSGSLTKIWTVISLRRRINLHPRKKSLKIITRRRSTRILRRRQRNPRRKRVIIKITRRF
ncbi:hypothetical protein GLOIN_2v1776609 [Rhizophagus irregularis DAOM 181602=DAOM 197198]|nr:hypothetical protein GLOIN_2v1776609 [Rhizophagus irregularis DAOM 181602=DAOM 197198]